MIFYTAVGNRVEEDSGRFVVRVGEQEKVLSEMETMIWAALTWSVCEEANVHSQMYRLLCIALGKEKAMEWADEEDFLFCLRRLKKRGLVAECEGENKEEALQFLLSKSVVVPVVDSFSGRVREFAENLVLGKGIKAAMRALKKPIFTYEELRVLQQISRNGYIPEHLASLNEQAGTVLLSAEEKKKVQDQVGVEFMQILISLYQKKQFVISYIKEGGFLEEKKQMENMAV